MAPGSIEWHPGTFSENIKIESTSTITRLTTRGWKGGWDSLDLPKPKVDWVLSIQGGSRVESGLQEKLHFCDLISKAIQYKMVPKRPETSSGCYKSQSFFFPRTSRNPTQPGNPKLNDTSSTPENKVQLFSTKISKDPIRLASKIRLNGLRQSSSVFNQNKGQLTVPRPVRAEWSGWADGLQIWASV